jgi:hypothetical protein
MKRLLVVDDLSEVNPVLGKLKRRRLSSTSFVLAVLLAVPGFAFAQTAPQDQTLIVNGQPAQATVIQMNGRSYVELESLARIANGSLSFNGNQITLTLPAAASKPVGTTAPQPPNPGLSRGFLAAAIEGTAAVREWRSAIATAIRNSYKVTDVWVSGLENQAAQGLQLASVAASSPSDQTALQLLTDEFNKMQAWSNQIITAHQSLEYLSPDEMNHDALFQQILTCARALASIYASGQFQDDGSCH